VPTSATPSRFTPAPSTSSLAKAPRGAGESRSWAVWVSAAALLAPLVLVGLAIRRRLNNRASES
jgi:hypothetical protein